jgi:hypothetical protein
MLPGRAAGSRLMNAGLLKRYEVAHREQQVVLLAHARLEVLAHLVRRECPVVHCHQPEDALELAVPRDFVAEHEGEGVVPVRQCPAARRVRVARVLAVHVDAPSVDRVVGRDDVLQGRLQVLVVVGRRELRVAGDVGAARPVVEVVAVEGLAEHEVAGRSATRVRHDPRVLLRDVAGRHPGLDRVFAGALDEVMELAARGRGALRLAALDVDAPAADPGHVAREVQVERRLDAARVIGHLAVAGLELPEPDDVAVVAVAAARDGPVVESERLRQHQRRIDRRRHDRAGEGTDRRLHRGRVRCAVAPAVVEFAAQAHHQP